jgi:Effector-associated domain 11
MNLLELKSLVSKLLIDDLDLALKTAQDGLPETAPKAKQVLLLLGKQADLKKGIARGILSAENIELGTNQVRSSLIDLMDTLTEVDLSAKSGAMAPVTAAKPKFVVVYDQADQEAASLLLRHMNILKFTGKLEIYDVNKDKGGENTLGRAQEEWANGDYMLALITVNLFNSENWFGMVYQALGDGRRVIPIRIQRADYEGTGLEKLRALPTQNRAVSDFGNADEAYTDIVTEIKRLLPGAR